MAQLRKLPAIVRRRRAVVAALGRRIKDARAVSLPKLLPGFEPSYWFLRMRFNPEAAQCGKNDFCNALAKEGLPIVLDYTINTPHRKDWFINKRVFGTSGLPWTSPLYKGNPNLSFPCPNVDKVGATHFNIVINEAWSSADIRDAAAIILKADAVLGRK